MRQAVAEPDVLDEVGRVGQACLAGPVVEDLQAAGAGHEVDAIAADVRVGLAVAIEEPERIGGAGDGALDDVTREADPLPARIGRQAGFEQPAAHLRAADLHARVRQDAHRLIDDSLDQLRAEGLDGRTHGRHILAARACFVHRSLAHRPEDRGSSERATSGTVSGSATVAR